MSQRRPKSLLIAAALSPRLLHGLAVIAIVCVVVRAFLLQLPEAFPGAATAGEIWSDLCIGYIAAWFFHMLVVVVPNQRQRARVLSAAKPDLRRVALTAAIIYGDLGRKKGQEVSDDPTLEEVSELCRTVRRDSRAPAFTFRGVLTSDSLDWVDYMVDELDEAARARNRLVPAFPYLDAEVVARMQPLADTQFERFARSAQRLGLISPDLEPIAPSLHEYVVKSRELELYLGSDISDLETSDRS